MQLKSLPPSGDANWRERIAPLAKLPVFWDLDGRRVVLAGGTEAAAWKAELLAACGAEVHVFCPDEHLSEPFRSLLSGRPDLAVLHHTHAWHAGIFDGASLALADCGTEEEAGAFFCAARAAGVPVNIIDRPAFCQFQFGSIVNRSPVVVAISTDGAAPILAQAIRRRIETLLPPALKHWAELAQSLRERIHGRLRPGSDRRRFWERFVDAAFSHTAPPADDLADLLIKDADRIASSGEAAFGCVTHVGAGPGEAELLTLKAVRALQAADVILFDDLVSGDVLELARREARRMLVGKRGGRESCRQEDINEMMVGFARAGKRVVRLKSGDPMIFGRAGEEIARLEAEGIPVEVVPGITAASAMAASLGVSLTHRDHAQSVRFITGHSRHGGLPDDIDWSSVADSRTTNVFYMGGRTASLISARLIAEGLSPDTPAVIVSDVSRASERQWRGRLADLAFCIDIVGYEQPVLIAVGNAIEPGRQSLCGSDAEAEAMSCRMARASDPLQPAYTRR